jgi:nitrogen fixation/metabolism regulation signal transduction histidine kinase
MDLNHPSLNNLFNKISVPGEGRARQIVANTVRTRTDKSNWVPILLRWRDVEVDEFTREAIIAALAGVDLSMHTGKFTEKPELPDLVGTYRYVAERLCHRVRNTIIRPSVRLRKLASIINEIQEPNLRDKLLSVTSEIEDSFRQVSRLVEFDISDEYFSYRSVVLADWVIEFNSRYSATNSPVWLTVPNQSSGSKLRILANNYHLDTIFGNLWNNSVQAVRTCGMTRGECRITLDIRATEQRRVEVLVSDNGLGIPASLADLAFHVVVSTKGEGRGRGLLEVQDAVLRLFGTLTLVPVKPEEYRICMSFPQEAP